MGNRSAFLENFFFAFDISWNLAKNPDIEIPMFQNSTRMFAINKSSHFRSASIDAKLHLKNINLLLLVCQLGLHSNTKRTIAVNVFSTYRKPICLSSQSYIAAIIASIGKHSACIVNSRNSETRNSVNSRIRRIKFRFFWSFH